MIRGSIIDEEKPPSSIVDQVDSEVVEVPNVVETQGPVLLLVQGKSWSHLIGGGREKVVCVWACGHGKKR